MSQHAMAGTFHKYIIIKEHSNTIWQYNNYTKIYVSQANKVKSIN